MYSKTLYAGWGDMDFNSHMRNTAYLDKAADVRQMFLMEHGFPIEEFMRLRIGPVVMKDELEYFKEVGLQQQITVTYALAGHAEDGSRFLLRHEIFRPDGQAQRTRHQRRRLARFERAPVDRPAAGFVCCDEPARADGGLRGSAIQPQAAQLTSHSRNCPEAADSGFDRNRVSQ